jgi:hypothetical protein
MQVQGTEIVKNPRALFDVLKEAYNANHKAHAVATTNGNSTKKQPKGSGGTKGAPDAVKKAMWAGLVAGSMAAGAVAARRASAEIWKSVFYEEPPTKNV